MFESPDLIPLSCDQYKVSGALLFYTTCPHRCNLLCWTRAACVAVAMPVRVALAVSRRRCWGGLEGDGPLPCIFSRGPWYCDMAIFAFVVAAVGVERHFHV